MFTCAASFCFLCFGQGCLAICVQLGYAWEMQQIHLWNLQFWLNVDLACSSFYWFSSLFSSSHFSLSYIEVGHAAKRMEIKSINFVQNIVIAYMYSNSSEVESKISL